MVCVVCCWETRYTEHFSIPPNQKLQQSLHVFYTRNCVINGGNGGGKILSTGNMNNKYVVMFFYVLLIF